LTDHGLGGRFEELKLPLRLTNALIDLFNLA